MKPSSTAPGAATTALVFNGSAILVQEETVSLTDMWRAAGADDSKRPSEWRRQPATVALVEYIEESVMGKSHNELFRAVTGGPNQGTFAHWQIAMAYAKYLSPAFHVWCNEVVRAHMTAAPPASDARLERQQARDAQALRKFQLDLRKLQVAALDRASASCAAAGEAKIAAIFAVKAAEVATGESYGHIATFAAPAEKKAAPWQKAAPEQTFDTTPAYVAPTYEPKPGTWLRPIQIAKKFQMMGLSITANMVGRIISEIGTLRGDVPGLCKAVGTHVQGYGQTTAYVYSSEAVKMIEARVRERIVANERPVYPSSLMTLPWEERRVQMAVIGREHVARQRAAVVADVANNPHLWLSPTQLALLFGVGLPEVAGAIGYDIRDNPLMCRQVGHTKCNVYSPEARELVRQKLERNGALPKVAAVASEVNS